MRHPAALSGTFLCLFAPAVLAAPSPTATAIDSYLKPFADTGNFSGSVLVSEKGQTIFEKSFGFADWRGMCRTNNRGQTTVLVILRLAHHPGLFS
jgi:hypothetical protein